MSAPKRRPRWALGLPVLAVMVAVAAALLFGRVDRSADVEHVPDPPVDAVAISSDSARHADLADLVAAADLVVRGEVAATERGRWFGGGAGGPRLQSRFVTLQVHGVLSGDGPRTPSLLIEEEGWLEDGAPVVVDGAAPSRRGDAGIWFLVEGGDPEVGAYVVVGADGRFLADGDGGLVGAEGDDPLVAELASRSLDELAEEIAAVG